MFLKNTSKQIYFLSEHAPFGQSGLSVDTKSYSNFLCFLNSTAIFILWIAFMSVFEKLFFYQLCPDFTVLLNLCSACSWRQTLDFFLQVHTRTLKRPGIASRYWQSHKIAANLYFLVVCGEKHRIQSVFQFVRYY